MKKKMIIVLLLVQAALNFPVFWEILLSKESIYEKGVVLIAFLYAYLVFSTLEIKLLSFLTVSKKGKIYKKKEKIWGMSAYLTIFCFLYIAYVFTGDLLMLATVLLAGGIVFTDISSTVIVLDDIQYYYSDKTLEMLEVVKTEKQNEVIWLELENGKKEVIPSKKVEF